MADVVPPSGDDSHFVCADSHVHMDPNCVSYVTERSAVAEPCCRPESAVEELKSADSVAVDVHGKAASIVFAFESLAVLVLVDVADAYLLVESNLAAPNGPCYLVLIAKLK